MPQKLNRDFYLQDTVTAARRLLGKILVHQRADERLAVEITETEAYTGTGDRACHSYGGRRTERTAVLYGPGGHAYLYLIYGMYWLFNVVTEVEESPCAVLVRGGRPVAGRDVICQNRFGKSWDDLTARQRSALLDGPGKVCRGLGLTGVQNRLDLTGDTLYLLDAPDIDPARIQAGPRIGVDYAGEDALLPYRFTIG